MWPWVNDFSFCRFLQLECRGDGAAATLPANADEPTSQHKTDSRVAQTGRNADVGNLSQEWTDAAKSSRENVTAPQFIHRVLVAALRAPPFVYPGKIECIEISLSLLLSKPSGSLHGFYLLHERQKEMRSPTYTPQHLVWILQTWCKANSCGGADICLYVFNLGVISVQKRLQKLNVQHIGNITKTYWTLKWLQGTFKHLWNSVTIPLVMVNSLSQQMRPWAKRLLCFCCHCLILFFMPVIES